MDNALGEIRRGILDAIAHAGRPVVAGVVLGRQDMARIRLELERRKELHSRPRTLWGLELRENVHMPADRAALIDLKGNVVRVVALNISRDKQDRPNP